MPRKQFDSYRINITHGTWADANISCYKNGVYQGTIYFVSGAVNEPTINSNGSLSLYYSFDKFESIYTVCREERPVYIEIWGASDKYCRVTTDSEPVGEEEGN
ncbi:MAG TPA: hypothetical protein DEA82_03120 [Flavobacteriaceae bacterium]|nr:hypothetical protein [Flavobacteriaceae bacterium]MAY53049.1 hypothetical protein [Flavobacteriaceae bacterium]HBR53214.1 hypothetical protein [Flavobacteriaceae bacterium]